MPISTEEFLDNIVRYGIEFYRVYPGLYRGIVTANDDPRKQGRIQAHVPSMQEAAPDIWIRPSSTGAGEGRGGFWPPEVGDPVYVSFAQGNPSRPECYFGGWFGFRHESSDVPEALGYSSDYPDVRGFVTRMGHRLVFSDTEGDERVELTWNKPDAGDAARTDRTATAGEGSTAQGGGSASLRFTPDGSVEISDSSNPGQAIRLDARQGVIEVTDSYGNRITLGASGAKIEATAIDLGGGAVEPVVKGQSWLNWAMSHTHPTPMGPSGVPVPPPTPALLSQVVRTK